MRYDVYGVKGEQPKSPFRVYDANGYAIHQVSFCDTVTGEVDRIVEMVSGIAKTTTEFHPHPLKIIPIGQRIPVAELANDDNPVELSNLPIQVPAVLKKKPKGRKQ